MHIRKDFKVKIAVIGGGIAGTTLNYLLQQDDQQQDKQYRINLYDKSRRLGGRASLVPIQDLQVPLAIGVRHCSINVEKLKDSKLTQDINLEGFFQDLGWQKLDHLQKHNSSASFELATDTWINIEQSFSVDPLGSRQNHSLYLSHHIKSLCFDQSTQTWQIDGECWVEQQKSTFSHTANYIMLSLPPQQVYDLLEETEFKIPNKTSLVPEEITRLKHRLEQVNTQSSWVILLKLPSRLLGQLQSNTLQNSKMIKSIKDLSTNLLPHQCADSSVIAIHLHHDWSAENMELDVSKIEELCLVELKSLLSNPTNIERSSIDVLKIHRWRYASSSLTDDLQQLYYPQFNLGLCGEAILKGQIDQGVERAILSALRLYSEINLSTECRGKSF